MDPKLSPGDWETRAFITRSSDRSYVRALDVIRGLPDSCLVFARTSHYRLMVVEELPPPPEMPGALGHRFQFGGMVRHVDAFYRIRDQITGDGDFWLLSQHIKREGGRPDE